MISGSLSLFTLPVVVPGTVPSEPLSHPARSTRETRRAQLP